MGKRNMKMKDEREHVRHEKKTWRKKDGKRRNEKWTWKMKMKLGHGKWKTKKKNMK